MSQMCQTRTFEAANEGMAGFSRQSTEKAGSPSDKVMRIERRERNDHHQGEDC
jgi:hypothetical protein